MHSSYSETVGQILPEGVERQLRSQLRSLRFEHPQEYARLQQLEVGKFLASKSLHNWLSEWELTKWDNDRRNKLLYFNLNNNNNNRNNLWHRRQQKNFKTDTDVQFPLIQEETENNLANIKNNVEYYYNNKNNINNNFNVYNNSDFNYLKSELKQKHSISEQVNSKNNVWNPFLNKTNNQQQKQHCFTNSFPSQMDASTNTATTEETITTTGTGRTMKVFRRASYLEEYAMNRVRQLEEERLAKEALLNNNKKQIKCCNKFGYFCFCLGCSKCCKKKKKKTTTTTNSSETATTNTNNNNNNYYNINSKNLNSSQNSSFPYIEQLSTSMSGKRNNNFNKNENKNINFEENNKPIVVVKFTLSSSKLINNNNIGVKNNYYHQYNERERTPCNINNNNYDNVTEEMLWKRNNNYWR